MIRRHHTYLAAIALALLILLFSGRCRGAEGRKDVAAEIAAAESMLTGGPNR